MSEHRIPITPEVSAAYNRRNALLNEGGDILVLLTLNNAGMVGGIVAGRIGVLLERYASGRQDWSAKPIAGLSKLLKFGGTSLTVVGLIGNAILIEGLRENIRDYARETRIIQGEDKQ